ncbi:hypothetical protein SGQ83_02225 [Flavobacterium sp. Fl-318]|uniref:Uncharacterized protein n=1 Tax=Flavobacterium cupriresistens TaxID=2893885 RepID=A0ABU4R6E6_9FLAO|nr:MULTISPECIES: hypothetical protein [unclassified Flavobacterium]MDX6188151.1 hypothetical protein [Flavobacterium sp. Fl-318]UFH41928.1 hypothetical protein LNP23_19225 [Flavobacterium sp. F-323]
MKNDLEGFRWMKYKNGKSYFAIVNLDIKKNGIKNEIVENYSGTGFSNQGIDVGAEGMGTWKKGLRNGLEFIVSKSSCFWTITINGLYGKPVTDTNPAIIGYTGILAFLEEAKVVIDEVDLEELERFVYHSWDNGNAEKIPNFEEKLFL